MNTELFYSTYHYADGEVHPVTDKPKDPFNATISLMPFTTNTASSDFDGSASLRGITGEFFRLESDVTVSSVARYDDIADTIGSYLAQKRLKPEAMDAIIRDILSIDGDFKPIDASFLKYAPVDQILKRGKLAPSKYGDGQSKLAKYLYSMLDEDVDITISHAENLLSRTIHEALQMGEITKSQRAAKEYFILPFIKEKFADDLKWLLSREDSVILAYIDQLLYFYCCFSLMQTAVRLDAHNYASYSDDEAFPFYYILDHESASDKRDVVQRGWAAKLSNEYLLKLYGRMQAVDMLNTLISDDGAPVGLYPQLLKVFNARSFDDEVKDECRAILKYCDLGKFAALKNRESGARADNLRMQPDWNVDSYEEFFRKLEAICRQYQSFEYHQKMQRRFVNVLKVRLLQTRRGRGNSVLVLDPEMLTLLIALVTREDRCKLKDMYKGFEAYGIQFDIATRQAIEELLLKLNILERRSDSGEAQYVKIVL